jgi:Uma2 family endonuclease
MTSATQPLSSPFPIVQPQSDRWVTLQGDWEKFRLIQQGCADTPNLRLFYFDGEIEILMPGQLHEIFSHALGVLLTNFLAHQGILFIGVGSADQEKPGIASAQPDQSYCLGQIKQIPDLALEVIFTSGSLKKLARYRVIGVTEVWFWEDGVLSLYHLRAQGYERIARSELLGLRDLDLEVLKRHLLMAEIDLGETVRSFNAYIFGQSAANS